uniref:CUB domain-containing protein n=1 Tax=Panagrolaimus sp. JU765 TaxID=591449 RepID=A0AC34RMM9_9BILA
LNPAEVNETSSKMSNTPFYGYKFCGNRIPYTIVSNNNTMTIGYKAMRPNSENSFWLSYTTLGCGGTILKNNSQLLAMESHFTSKHELRECHWTIKAPVGFVVKVDIAFGYFMGDPNGKEACDDPIKSKEKKVDGIEFTSIIGKNGTGYPQKIFCGLVKNQTFISQGNEIFALMRLSELNEMSSHGTIFDAKV